MRREEYYAQKINARQEQYDQEEKKRQAQKLGTLAGVIDFVKVLYNDRPKRKRISRCYKKGLICNCFGYFNCHCYWCYFMVYTFY